MAEVFVGPDITDDGIADADITPAGSFVVIDGAQFTDAVNVGSGTGNFNTFLSVQDSNDAGDVEQGFNTDVYGGAGNEEIKADQNHTHSVTLANLVQITVGGIDYYQFRIDLNEANSDPNAQISLDEFQVYTSTPPTVRFRRRQRFLR
jgi:hypothetical protein